VEYLPDGRFLRLVSWIEKEEIKIVRVTENGKAGKPITISRVSQKELRDFRK